MKPTTCLRARASRFLSNRYAYRERPNYLPELVLFGVIMITATVPDHRGLREKPRFSEISGLRSLRKGWMNDANLNSINSADEQTSKTPRVVPILSLTHVMATLR